MEMVRREAAADRENESILGGIFRRASVRDVTETRPFELPVFTFMNLQL